jgi:protein ImuB
MFACLYSLSTPVAALTALAESFTPRFERRGPLVLLDLSGLTRLFGSMEEIGEHLRRAAPGPMRIAIAPTQTAAALLALGRAGLSMVTAADQAAALAVLPVDLVGRFDEIQGTADESSRKPSTPVEGLVVSERQRVEGRPVQPPSVGPMWDALPMFESMLERTSELAVRAHRGGGWTHPRDAHAAHRLAGARSSLDVARDDPELVEGSGQAARTRAIGQLAESSTPVASASARESSRERRQDLAGAASSRRGGGPVAPIAPVLRRWGIKTLGALAALPAGEVYERLGARGVRWQRLARGEDSCPLVPWVPEDPFEASLALEWPIEGLEPLSFVLGRLLEPLSDRLERADRGAVVLHTHLRLVSKTVHARTVPLPAPMRDPKTLRTLILLDLESNPPSAAVDEVRVMVEPTPARVLQWMLYERAQPSPEQTATLIARLTALMGDGHVGSPELVDSWKPGVFTMAPFTVRSDNHGHRDTETQRQNFHRLDDSHSALGTPRSALRRFRLPVPVRVQVKEGRPVRVMSDRRGVSGGAIVQSAGPWRTSGEWWNDAPHPSPLSHPPSLAEERASDGETSPKRPSAAKAGLTCWDRDEWDVALADGTIYRVYVERDVGQWFVEGIVD